MTNYTHDYESMPINQQVERMTDLIQQMRSLAIDANENKSVIFANLEKYAMQAHRRCFRL